MENNKELPQVPSQKAFEIKIDKEHEYRIYFSENYEKEGKNLELKLTFGTAEIFGAELTPYKTYIFKPGTNFFIYTWEGCKIETNIKDHKFYDPSESFYQDHPMTVVANIALFLNELRNKVIKETKKVGPRVLITGQNYCGKSTVQKILVNYGCKLGWEPLIVDLDQSSNDILTGGCVSASQIKYSYPDSFVNEKNKIVYFTGQTTLNGEIHSSEYNKKEPRTNLFNKSLYKKTIQNLANVVNSKLETDLKKTQNKLNLTKEQQQYKEIFQQLDKQSIFASGSIINMPYFQEEHRKELIPLIKKSFKVDVIIVIEDEHLYNDLAREYHPHTHVLFCKKFGAVIGKDNRIQHIEQKNNALLQDYFMGLNGEIQCTKFAMPINKIKLYYFQDESNLGEISVKAHRWDPSNLNIVKKVVGILQYQHTNKNQIEEEFQDDDGNNNETQQQQMEEEDDEEEDIITDRLLSSPLMMLGHIDKISENDTMVELLLPSNNFTDHYVRNVLTKHPFIIGNLNWVGQK